MSQQQVTYIVTPSADVPFKIECTNDKPDVREWLINLRRDDIRRLKQLDTRIKQLDALIAQLPIDK